MPNTTVNDTPFLTQETELAILYELMTLSRRLQNVAAIVELALDKVMHLLGAEAVIFYLAQPQDQRLQARATRGVQMGYICSEFTLDNDWNACIAHIHTWTDPEQYPFPKNPFMGMLPVKAAIGVPVQGETNLLGWIYAARVAPHVYSKNELALYNVLANQIATTLEITIAWERNQKQQHILTAANQQLRQALTEIEQRTVKLIRTTKEAQKAREAAEAANRAKSIFLANVSHELRTPLNAILGFTQLITRDAGLTAEQLENLLIISRSGEHLLNLINDVLEISKIEAGRVMVIEQNVDMYRMLDDVEDMFHLRAMEQGVLLTFTRDTSVPRVVRTDEGKLRQVLINLLSNAVKFTPHGSVSLTVHMQQPAESQETYRLSFAIEDTGVGIAEDELETLFEEFVQTRSGLQTQEGTGLGLPISRHFVRLMGGDITVHSKVGRGTVFFFDIPCTLGEENETNPTNLASHQSSRRALRLATDQPVYRILVVEDDWTNRKLLTRLLQTVGFAVREAVNGQEAIDLWEHWNPHLIWMDMRMPILDGYEATRQIKAHSAGSETVIIALTASAFEEQRSVAISAGCDDFVRKPFPQSLIFDKMKEHLHVQFVYEDEELKRQKQDQEPMDEAAALDALATLPAHLVEELHLAASVADIDHIGEILEHIRQHNSMLADVLTDLTHNFRLDLMVSWTSGKDQ